MVEPEDGAKATEPGQGEEFGELLKFTAFGYVGGLILGFVLDTLGLQRSPIGQWLVRTVAGEGESILEGAYAIRQRFRGAFGSMAEAYGWGKFIGLIFPWIVDWGSRSAGIDAYGWESFYIPYFYAMSDQVGGSVAGFVFLCRREGDWRRAAAGYFHHPVMLTSLAVILVVPVGLLAARLIGFAPSTQVYTAVETIAANLCWVPPLVGWFYERKR